MTTALQPDPMRCLKRTIAADLDEDQPHLRRPAEPTTMVQFMLRINDTHELPLVVETPKGRIIARFARAGDLAIFVSKDRKTLPARFVELLAGGQ